MEVTLSYRFEADKPVRQIAEEVEINAILENPGVWTKTFVLVPPTEKSGPFTVTFPLDSNDFSHFSDVYKSIAEETGVSVPQKLTIKADVHTVAQTEFGLVDEEFSQTLSTTLGEKTMEWKEELISSKPGVIKTSMMVSNPKKYLGLSISGVRNLSAALAGVFFLFFLFSVLLYVRFEAVELFLLEKKALQARKKHKDVIIGVKELPEAKAGEVVIPLTSLEELLKVADALLKPVLHKAEPEKDTYCLIDGVTRYQYLLDISKKEPGSNAGKSE